MDIQTPRDRDGSFEPRLVRKRQRRFEGFDEKILALYARGTRGYTANKDQLLARLERIEGQIRGIEGMVQDDRYCIDILTRISAAQAALDKVALGLLDGHAHHYVIGARDPGERDAKTDELMGAVGRLMRRG